MPKAKTTVYEKGEALEPGLFSALDKAIEQGAIEFEGKKLKSAPVDSLEAAVMKPRPGTEMAYVGIPRRGQPDIIWRSVARFEERQIGSQKFSEARAIRSALSASYLAGLEAAQGREPGYGVENPREAFPVELEGVVYATLPSGSKVIYARYKGLWFGVERLTKIERLPDPPSRIEQGYNYPEVSIT